MKNDSNLVRLLADSIFKAHIYTETVLISSYLKADYQTQMMPGMKNQILYWKLVAENWRRTGHSVCWKPRPPGLTHAWGRRCCPGLTLVPRPRPVCSDSTAPQYLGQVSPSAHLHSSPAIIKTHFYCYPKILNFLYTQFLGHFIPFNENIFFTKKNSFCSHLL